MGYTKEKKCFHQHSSLACFSEQRLADEVTNFIHIAYSSVKLQRANKTASCVGSVGALSPPGRIPRGGTGVRKRTLREYGRRLGPAGRPPRAVSILCRSISNAGAQRQRVSASRGCEHSRGTVPTFNLAATVLTKTTQGSEQRQHLTQCSETASPSRTR